MASIRAGIKIAAASVVVMLLAVLVPFVLFAQQTTANQIAVSPEVMKWGFIAAAASVGASTIAGAIAVGMVGAAAMGVVGERPEVAPRALIFVGLAEGIAIYGLIVSVMILGKLR
jgi:V/A-type H+/Na+-transporting ATPase subunit K